jgi:uncharacterized protein YeaO (DUF488 family)
MNKQTAQTNGLVFTGIYTRDKDVAVIRCGFLRDNGYKAHVVTVPDSPQSRGPIGTGYSVYAENKWARDQRADELRKRANGHAQLVASMRARFEQELAQVEQQNAERVQWLLENNYAI